MLQKIQFVAAIIHEPDLVILDEPFSGLDPVSIATAARADHRGARARCDDPVLDARDAAGRRDLRPRRDDPSRPQDARRPRELDPQPLRSARASARAARCGRGRRRRALARRRGELRAHEGAYNVELEPGVDVGGAISRIAAALPVARIEVRRPRLEDVFVQIVTDRGDSADAARALRAELAGQSAPAAT